MITGRAGLCFDQRPVHREPVVAQPLFAPRLGQRRFQKLARNVGSQQSLPVLAECARIPHPLVSRSSHEPAKSQVQIDLVHQGALTADAIQHLQQHAAQQPFGRDRTYTGRHA